ncbi:hemerythrin domain-containing protein [Thiocapsa sp.]|uniref:hemerythrin domain-containing protein n=1 Tax=Thiocapsa sp. TaxID=2024551 RepID=UPI002C96114B|nr:hemerythrin domain-containing protein [Thiocapsa sp.]HSO84178.1 hemerythrin domain-containing protein [Thiocapsa sp.]
MMTAITDTFTEDHHRCDRLLAEAEASAGGSDWSAIGAAAGALVTAMDRHFALEEEVVFPALAQVFFVAENPIEIMCNEHAQMRQLLAEIGAAVDARDKNALLGILETLHLLVQQHNYKEEGIIYPMADGALPERAADMAAMIADV